VALFVPKLIGACRRVEKLHVTLTHCPFRCRGDRFGATP
jgi:hypothetical protein